MSGLYLHIPFCKKKCSYCNFHFSTQLQLKSKLIEMMGNELELRKNEMQTPIKTIYFGGGTPSLLNEDEILFLFHKIYSFYNTSELIEVTLECNPNDLSYDFLNFLKKETPVNRLSIGIQSFFDVDLKFMNRSHHSMQGEECIKMAQEVGFKNITIDLIYGGETTSDEQWIKNLEKAISLGVPHISAYALTVEPKTALENNIRKGKLPPADEDKQAKQFHILRNLLSKKDFIQYEFSNFGKQGFFSKHNISYWENLPYLGIGPSAHSYNGKDKRCWNISNNVKYINALEKNKLPLEIENISDKDRFNETIMLGLRTYQGISLKILNENFSSSFLAIFNNEAQKLINDKKLICKDNYLTVNPEYLFLTDGIISQLFLID
ncbi:radical SAM family heme chaperone HemW [Apibacter muscae]|uniref:radical SAM family heme chaperone HemW n=1 Tax=Apibacter muscae TaxID=2509004 RepID=UPI0011ABF66D|nr:radical SAM family heme chaperone HemW [Apibacter muscae]TWP28241.1 radical SAM family heme chaperone HemW [Apibacter muscae]